MDVETVINLNDERSLFTNEKKTITQLSKLGLPIKKQNEYGVCFDLSQAVISVKVNKIRGNGYKESEI